MATLTPHVHSTTNSHSKHCPTKDAANGANEGADGTDEGADGASWGADVGGGGDDATAERLSHTPHTTPIPTCNAHV